MVSNGLLRLLLARGVIGVLAGGQELALASQPEAPATETPWIERAQSITASAFAELSAELLRAMAEGGVAGALEVCSEKALPLTAKIAEREGATLRRAAVRYRNPANEAGDLERHAIAEYEKQAAAGEELKPQLHFREDGGATVLAPIRIVMPTCLQCHGVPGQDIREGDLAVLRRLYPEDRATGFAMGDVRGVWRVDFPSPTNHP